MKSLSRHIPLVFLLGSLAAAVPAQAQEFKAGFVNTDRIFREANTAKTAQAKLEQEFSKREKELVDMGNALKSATEKFEREAPTMAESQRVTRQPFRQFALLGGFRLHLLQRGTTRFTGRQFALQALHLGLH